MTAYHQRSGRVSLPLVLLGFALSVAALYFLAFLYGRAGHWSVPDWIAVLITAVYGALAGVLGAVFVVYMGRARSLWFAYVVGAILGMLAIYLAWPPYLQEFFGFPAAFRHRLYQPGPLLTMIRNVAEIGPWKLGDRSETINNGPWYYYAHWIGEAAVVTILAGLITGSCARESVFCEDCNAWTATKRKVAALAPESPAMVKAALEEGHFEVLDLLPALSKNHAEDIFFEVRLDTCNHCEESDHLTVEQVEKIVKKGKTQQKRTDVVKFLRIPRVVTERLRNPGAAAPEPPPASLSTAAAMAGADSASSPSAPSPDNPFADFPDAPPPPSRPRNEDESIEFI